MEFWGVEVKSGQPLAVNLGEDKVLHLSQANLGEIKNNKTNESVCLHINIEGKKLVLGTLNSERFPQQLFDLVIDQDFQLSHNWKNGSVYFYGYKADQPLEDDDDVDEDTDEEDVFAPLPIANGKQEIQKGESAAAAASAPAPAKKDGKQKVRIVEPEKDKEDDSDSDSDDSIAEDSDSDEDDEDSSDGEDSSDEDEETPKKQPSGKKRPNETEVKTPATDKKAKMSTPEKSGGKKAVAHVATPHPSKQTKTPANKSNQKTPASASTDGAFSCKPCNRTFKSDGALQSHNQAKHK